MKLDEKEKVFSKMEMGKGGYCPVKKKSPMEGAGAKTNPLPKGRNLLEKGRRNKDERSNEVRREGFAKKKGGMAMMKGRKYVEKKKKHGLKEGGERLRVPVKKRVKGAPGQGERPIPRKKRKR